MYRKGGLTNMEDNKEFQYFKSRDPSLAED